jgi:hypothetical protein
MTLDMAIRIIREMEFKTADELLEAADKVAKAATDFQASQRAKGHMQIQKDACVWRNPFGNSHGGNTAAKK